MWATRTDLLSSPALRREGGGDSKRPRQVKWVRQGLPASDKSPGGVMAAMSYNPSCRGELSTWRQVGSGGRHPLDDPRKLGRRRAQPRKATTVPGTPRDKDRLVSKRERRRCRTTKNCTLAGRRNLARSHLRKAKTRDLVAA